jgi:hypothetical protein
MFPPGLRGMLPERLLLFPAPPFGPAAVLAAPLPVMKTSLEVVAFGGNIRRNPEAAEFDAGAELSAIGAAFVYPGVAWVENGDGSLEAVWPAVRTAEQDNKTNPKNTAVNRGEFRINSLLKTFRAEKLRDNTLGFI